MASRLDTGLNGKPSEIHCGLMATSILGRRFHQPEEDVISASSEIGPDLLEEDVTSTSSETGSDHSINEFSSPYMAFAQTDAGTHQIEEFSLRLDNLARIYSGILVPSPEQVRPYLDCYPELEVLAYGLCHDLREAFGKDYEISLELSIDPEIDDEYLVAFVRGHSYDRSTMSIIRKVYDKYMDAICESEGYLHATTDFQPPKR